MRKPEKMMNKYHQLACPLFSRKSFMTVLFSAGLGFLVLTTSSCHTVEGFGQDLQKAGNTVEKVARETTSEDRQDGPIYDDLNR